MAEAHYEVMEPLAGEDGESSLVASYTPNNGIRIGIINDDVNPEAWAEFDFSPKQARLIGNALLRWAADNHGKE